MEWPLVGVLNTNEVEKCESLPFSVLLTMIHAIANQLDRVYCTMNTLWPSFMAFFWCVSVLCHILRWWCSWTVHLDMSSWQNREGLSACSVKLSHRICYMLPTELLLQWSKVSTLDCYLNSLSTGCWRSPLERKMMKGVSPVAPAVVLNFVYFSRLLDIMQP